MPLSGGASEVHNELPGSRQLLRLPEPVTMTTIGSGAREPVDTPIPSPRMEGIVNTASSLGAAAPSTSASEAEQVTTTGPDAVESATARSEPQDDAGAAPIGPIVAVVMVVVGAGVVLVRRHKRPSS